MGFDPDVPVLRRDSRPLCVRRGLHLRPAVERSRGEFLPGHEGGRTVSRRSVSSRQGAHVRDAARVGVRARRVLAVRSGGSAGVHGAAVTISDLVISGRITPEQGAWLYELRHEIAWRRKPWWERALLRLLWGGRPL